MISYAQNGEDVVLARALPWPTGFYVDVGAADPESASVSKHFYVTGWHGINIDPRAASFYLLREHRPRDINLQVAAGESDGTKMLFVFDHDPHLSTTDIADRDLLASQGFAYGTEEVEMRSLDSVFSEYRVERIDFLKIDVEGSESDVLSGIDLARWRPRVVVVEATEPWSHKRRDLAWRPILEGAGYVEGCFDGINLFFAHADDPEVLRRLTPACALDDYRPAYVAALQAEVADLRAGAHETEDELRNYRTYQETLTQYISRLEGNESRRRRAPTVASGEPVGSAGQVSTLHIAPLPAERWTPPPLSRLAVIASPSSGGSWYGEILAAALNAPEIQVSHPAEVDWNDLPDRFVVELCWRRTWLLAEKLEREGVTVVSPSRHPLDALLSMAESNGVVSTGGGTIEDPGPAFLRWASSVEARESLDITPSWWKVPRTCRVRYEDLFSLNTELVERILEECSLEAARDLSIIVRDTYRRLHDPTVGSPDAPGAWRNALSPADAELLGEIHHEVFEILGYSLGHSANGSTTIPVGEGQLR